MNKVKTFAFLLFCHSYIALLFNALHDAEKERIIIHLNFAIIHSIFRRLIHWVPQGLALRVTLPKVFWPIFSIHCSAKRPVNQVRQGPKSNLPQETTIVSIIYLHFLIVVSAHSVLRRNQMENHGTKKGPALG